MRFRVTYVEFHDPLAVEFLLLAFSSSSHLIRPVQIFNIALQKYYGEDPAFRKKVEAIYAEQAAVYVALVPFFISPLARSLMSNFFGAASAVWVLMSTQTSG
jgi:hypothetical protein